MSNVFFQNSKFGLPISDGNEWNTGGGYPYSHAPFGGSLTPGSNFPTVFNPYVGAGYNDNIGAGAVDIFNIKTFATQDPGANNDLQTMRGGDVKITAPDIMDRKTFTTWAQWIEDNPVLGGAIVTGGIGVVLYLLIGKK